MSRTSSPRPAPDRVWYSEGLRFECTQCGNCCTGPPGAVWFTADEGADIARTLNIADAEFYARFAHRIDGQWSLVERETPHGFDCVFLDRQSRPGKAVCSIYHARPLQCRTWPFWPEMLESARQWRTYKRVTPCPGMDSGTLIPVEQIRIQRAMMRE